MYPTRPQRRPHSFVTAIGLLGLLSACAGAEAARAPDAESTGGDSSAAVGSTGEAAAVEATETAAPEVTPAASASIHGLTMTRLDGQPASLSEYRGKTLLVVNTASKCGHTPQYEGLQALHAKYASRGFAVLGFPSNDFGGQEPGTSEEIATFCTSIYAVSFPMFEKVKTKGPDRSELYALLSEALGEPHWNFHKYLIDAEGRPLRAWPSGVQPEAPEIVTAIEEQLGAH